MFTPGVHLMKDKIRKLQCLLVLKYCEDTR